MRSSSFSRPGRLPVVSGGLPETPFRRTPYVGAIAVDAQTGRVLYVDPMDANRFRVLSSPEFGRSPAVPLACAIAATLALVFVVPELLALALGVFAVSCLARS